MLLATFAPPLAASRARDEQPPHMWDVQCMSPLCPPHSPWPAAHDPTHHPTSAGAVGWGCRCWQLNPWYIQPRPVHSNQGMGDHVDKRPSIVSSMPKEPSQHKITHPCFENTCSKPSDWIQRLMKVSPEAQKYYRAEVIVRVSSELQPFIQAGLVQDRIWLGSPALSASSKSLEVLDNSQLRCGHWIIMAEWFVLG